MRLAEKELEEKRNRQKHKKHTEHKIEWNRSKKTVLPPCNNKNN